MLVMEKKLNLLRLQCDNDNNKNHNDVGDEEKEYFLLLLRLTRRSCASPKVCASSWPKLTNIYRGNECMCRPAQRIYEHEKAKSFMSKMKVSCHLKYPRAQPFLTVPNVRPVTMPLK